ncbi:hypothetical protein [Bradyrhizobium sp. SZCCHNS2005]|uniref:hypothetical protein n=1 Tax=unclassified Bradyrhizobium TaxID=2631580 RepID=UPI003964875F
MFSRKERLSSTRRPLTIAIVATMALTVFEPPVAFARDSGQAAKQSIAVSARSDATDFSARRRYRRYYYRSNPAAGLAVMGAMIGTIGAIAAANRYDGYYYYGPGYYYGPPVYYAPYPYYYGPRAYPYYYPW